MGRRATTAAAGERMVVQYTGIPVPAVTDAGAGPASVPMETPSRLWMPLPHRVARVSSPAHFGG